MATLLGTYQFDLNRLTPTTGVVGDVTVSKAVAWSLMAQLVDAFSVGLTGKWECVYCSNGYGSGGSHGTSFDIWFNGGVFNVAKLAAGTGGPANYGAMCAVRAPASFPGGNRPTILLVHQAPQDGYFYDWRWLATNGTVTPPATMGYLPTVSGGAWADTSTPGGYWNWLLSLGSEYMQRKCHLVMATDGAFFWSASRIGITRILNGVAVLPLVQPAPGDTAPWVFFRGGPGEGDANTGYPSATYPSSKSGWSAARWWGAHGQNSPGYGAMGSNVAGTAAARFFPSHQLVQSAAGDAKRLLTEFAGLDPARQTYPEFPVWLTDSNGCVRGYPRDLWQCKAHVEGTVDPSGVDAITRMCWGEHWVPSPNTATPILF